MAGTESKLNSPAAKVSPGASNPYDPLDLRTLAESMAKVVLEQPVYPLADVPAFDGAGVYIIYYTGTYEPYKPIAHKNKGHKWEQPIYVGEAARKGGRKGGVLVEGPAEKVLFNRLKNHAYSIRNAKNLDAKDFWCRYLAIKDFFIPLCESLLIDRYIPIWNKVIDGFGNKVVGAERERERTACLRDAEHRESHATGSVFIMPGSAQVGCPQ